MEKVKYELGEIYNLNTSICKFIIPRLIAYKNIVKETGIYNERIGSNKKWVKILNKIIKAFKLELKIANLGCLSKKDEKNYKKGMELFSEYFDTLWLWLFMKIDNFKVYNIDLKFEKPVYITLFYSHKFEDDVVSLKIYKSNDEKSVLILEEDYNGKKSTKAFIVDNKEIITIK